MKNMLIITGIIILIGLVYWFGMRDDENKAAVTVITPPPPTENVADPELSPAENSEWLLYSSTEHGFNIDHPEDVEVQDTGDGVLLSKWGPTQQEGTEFYDGISLNFMSDSLDGMTLEEFVNQEQAESEEDPIIDEVTVVEQVTVGNNTGFRFTVMSLGEFTYIYLPKGTDEYLRITDSTQDPSDQGFDRTVDEMLQTLTIE